MKRGVFVWTSHSFFQKIPWMFFPTKRPAGGFAGLSMQKETKSLKESSPKLLGEWWWIEATLGIQSVDQKIYQLNRSKPWTKKHPSPQRPTFQPTRRRAPDVWWDLSTPGRYQKKGWKWEGQKVQIFVDDFSLMYILHFQDVFQSHGTSVGLWNHVAVGKFLEDLQHLIPDVVCLFGMVLIEEAFAVCIEAASNIWGAFTAKTEEILTDPHIEKL